MRSEIALSLEEPNPFTLGLLETAGALFGRKFRERAKKWRKEIRASEKYNVSDAIDRLESRIAERKRAGANTINWMTAVGILLSAAAFFSEYGGIISTTPPMLGQILSIGVFGGLAVSFAFLVFSQLKKNSRYPNYELYTQLEELHALERASLEERVSKDKPID